MTHGELCYLKHNKHSRNLSRSIHLLIILPILFSFDTLSEIKIFTDSGSLPLVVIEFSLIFIRAISRLKMCILIFLEIAQMSWKREKKHFGDHPSMFPYTVAFRIALDENLGHFTNYFDHFTQYILVILLENCIVIKWI